MESIKLNNMAKYDIKFENWIIETEINNSAKIPLVFNKDIISERYFSWVGRPYCSHLIIKVDKFYKGQFNDRLNNIFQTMPLYIKTIKLKIFDDIELIKTTTSIRTTKNYIEELKEKIIDLIKGKNIEFIFLDENQEDDQVYDEGTIVTKYRVTHFQDEIPIVDELVWDNIKSPIPNYIPHGIKVMSFIYLNQPIGPGLIPDSVTALFLKVFNQDLSHIAFPPRLKYLSFNNFSQQMYRNLDIPLTVTHMQLVLNRNYIYPFLFELGTLPRNLSHLKLILLYNFVPQKPFLVPSSLRVIDLGDIKEPLDKFVTIVDEKEYFKQKIHRHVPTHNSNLKSIVFPSSYDQYFTQQTLPPTLESLDILNLLNRDLIEVEHIPKSVTWLKCRSSKIPDDVSLNFLHCTVEKSYVSGLIMKDDNRSITKQSIATLETLKSSSNHIIADGVNDTLSLPIDKLLYTYNDISSKEFIFPNVQVKSLKVYSIPTTYPKSVQHIQINCPFHSDPSDIPSTVEKLDITIVDISDYQDSQIMDQYLIKKYNNNSNSNNNYNNNNNSNDLYLKIWRNIYLKKKIYEYYYPTIMGSNSPEVLSRFNNLNLHVKTNQTYLPRQLEGLNFKSYIPYDGKVKKIEVRSFFKIPDGVTHLKIRKEITQKLKIHRYIPSSVYWLYFLQLECLEIDKVPDTIRHLVIKTTQIKPTAIPASVETLEIRSCKESIDHLEDIIPLTVKKIILPQSYFIKYPIPDYLVKRNLLDRKYQVYVKGTPVSPSTNILIWKLNEIIPRDIVPFGVSTILFGDEFNQTILKDTLPSSITEIIFGLNFHQCISNIHLPTSVKYLEFRGAYRFGIIKNSFPPLVTHLSFTYGGEYRHPKTLVNLPSTISHLDLVCDNGFSSDLIPHVQHLKLRSKKSITVAPSLKSIQTNTIVQLPKPNNNINNYDQIEKERAGPVFKFPNNISLDLTFNSIIIPGTLANMNIKTLRYKANQCIHEGALPNSIESLYLSNFSQEYFVSPPFLKVLSLTSPFNYPLLKCMLPDTLEELYLDYKFDQPILPNTLPKSLKILQLGSSFNQPLLKGSLPDGLKTLIFQSDYTHEIGPDILPNQLQSLSVVNASCEVQSLPPSLEELLIGSKLQSLMMTNSFSQMCNLKKLELYFHVTKDHLDQCPSSLVHLSLKPFNTLENGACINGNDFPNSITNLELDSLQMITNINLLPPNIKSLKLNSYFSGILPPTIEHLELLNSRSSMAGGFNKSIETFLY